MQLIQPYVQKSRSTIFPRRSASFSFRFPVLIQSRLSGNSGALTDGAGVNSRGMDVLAGCTGVPHEPSAENYCEVSFPRTGCICYSLCAEVATVLLRTPISELVIWLQPESRRVVARRVEEKPALALVAGSLQPGKAPEERAQRARVPDAKVQLGRAPDARVPAVRVQRGKPRLARAHPGAPHHARSRVDASSRFPAARPLPAPPRESRSGPSQLQNASSE